MCMEEKTFAFRVNVLMDGVNNACSMHQLFCSLDYGKSREKSRHIFRSESFE